ncbi:MAG: ATP-grasp domain-containing protein [Flavobacteriaceae bacterium]
MGGVFSTAGTPSISRARNKISTLWIIGRKGIPLSEALFEIDSDTFYTMDTNILIQEYSVESNGEDIRILVVGNKMEASLKRTCWAGEFRSNVHHGGSTEAIVRSKNSEFIALEANKHIGLAVAGVDLIRSKKGPLLIEVNASPGLQGMEKATGGYIAKEIVMFLERNRRRRKSR